MPVGHSSTVFWGMFESVFVGVHWGYGFDELAYYVLQRLHVFERPCRSTPYRYQKGRNGEVGHRPGFAQDDLVFVSLTQRPFRMFFSAL